LFADARAQTAVHLRHEVGFSGMMNHCLGSPVIMEKTR
jgi:hypothetical protein